MVQGIPELKRRFANIAPIIKQELRPALASAAAGIVAQMNQVKPLPEIQIEWVWGDPPSGTVSLGRVAGSAGDREFISIYATAVTSIGAFPAVARWFEFGTAQRRHASGKSTGAITAQPYFFPVYRANKSKVRSIIGRKVNKVVRSL